MLKTVKIIGKTRRVSGEQKKPGEFVTCTSEDARFLVNSGFGVYEEEKSKPKPKAKAKK